MLDGGLRAPAGAAGDGGDGRRGVSIAPARDCGSGNGNREDTGVFAAGDLKRAARGDFDSDEIAAGAAVSEGRTVFAEILCAEFESRGDEGAFEFSVQSEDASDGGSADAARNGGDGRVPPDSRLEQIHGDWR